MTPAAVVRILLGPPPPAPPQPARVTCALRGCTRSWPEGENDRGGRPREYCCPRHKETAKRQRQRATASILPTAQGILAGGPLTQEALAMRLRMDAADLGRWVGPWVREGYLVRVGNRLCNGRLAPRKVPKTCTAHGCTHPPATPGSRLCVDHRDAKQGKPPPVVARIETAAATAMQCPKCKGPVRRDGTLVSCLDRAEDRPDACGWVELMSRVVRTGVRA